MGSVSGFDFAEVIEAAQAEVMARAEREAERQGITVDELWERQRLADEAHARHQKHALLAEERAERIRAISPGLTAEVAHALCSGSLETGPTRPAMAAVRAWVASDAPRPVLVLAGGTGTGKTVAAAWALSRLGGEYVRSVDLARRSEPYRGEAEPLNVAAHELLVLDDLGTETRSAAGALDRRFMPALYDIVDQRQGVMRRGTRWIPRRTLITTNLTKKQFVEAYPDERIRSRLAQSCTWVALDGVDQRRKGSV